MFTNVSGPTYSPDRYQYFQPVPFHASQVEEVLGESHYAQLQEDGAGVHMFFDKPPVPLGHVGKTELEEVLDYVSSNKPSAPGSVLHFTMEDSGLITFNCLERDVESVPKKVIALAHEVLKACNTASPTMTYLSIANKSAQQKQTPHIDALHSEAIDATHAPQAMATLAYPGNTEFMIGGDGSFISMTKNSMFVDSGDIDPAFTDRVQPHLMSAPSGQLNLFSNQSTLHNGRQEDGMLIMVTS